jgi:hypothetical protein
MEDQPTMATNKLERLTIRVKTQIPIHIHDRLMAYCKVNSISPQDYLVSLVEKYLSAQQ